MNKLKTLFSATVALTLLALLPSVANAQGSRHSGSINHRQEQQRDRIHHGVRKGALTPREAARLRAREASIRAREHRDRRDGHGLSRWERQRIDRSLKRTHRDIHRQSNDRQHRP